MSLSSGVFILYLSFLLMLSTRTILSRLREQAIQSLQSLSSRRRKRMTTTTTTFRQRANARLSILFACNCPSLCCSRNQRHSCSRFTSIQLASSGSHSWAACVSCPVPYYSVLSYPIVSNPILNPVQISTHHIVCYQPIFFPSSSHLTSVHLFIYPSIHTSIHPLDILSNLSTVTSQPFCWQTKYSSYTNLSHYCLLRTDGWSLKWSILVMSSTS